MTYLEQNNQLFEGVINQFFKLWKHSYEEQDKILSGQGLSIRDSSLELFITPQCNQSCEYCYLAKNKDLLYPEEIRDEE